MISNTSVTVTGAQETAAFMNNAASSVTESISEGLAEVGNDIRNTTTSLAPVDTGFMQSQINVNNFGDSLLAKAGADYSSYVDEGTSRMSAQPFFTEPIKEIAGGASQIIDSIITNRIGSNR